MKSSFLPKYEQKISALCSESRNLDNFSFIFWEKILGLKIKYKNGLKLQYKFGWLFYHLLIVNWGGPSPRDHYVGMQGSTENCVKYKGIFF